MGKVGFMFPLALHEPTVGGGDTMRTGKGEDNVSSRCRLFSEKYEKQCPVKTGLFP